VTLNVETEAPGFSIDLKSGSTPVASLTKSTGTGNYPIDLDGSVTERQITVTNYYKTTPTLYTFTQPAQPGFIILGPYTVSSVSWKPPDCPIGYKMITNTYYPPGTGLFVYNGKPFTGMLRGYGIVYGGSIQGYPKPNEGSITNGYADQWGYSAEYTTLPASLHILCKQN
jgi:hypothetical protein